MKITELACHVMSIPGPDGKTPKRNWVFVEIQTGSYFGEDDVERVEDDYGRV